MAKNKGVVLMEIKEFIVEKLKGMRDGESFVFKIKSDDGININNKSKNTIIFTISKEAFKTQPKKCEECKDELKSKEEIEFGQCDACCAWKYRDCCK